MAGPRRGAAPGILEASFSSVRRARRVLDGLPMAAEARDRTALVLSELATNAVLHGGGGFTLRLWYTREWARLEVQDASAKVPTFPKDVPPASRLGGRGLFIVEALASRVGIELRGSGKVVWAEVGERPAGYIDI